MGCAPFLELKTRPQQFGRWQGKYVVRDLCGLTELCSKETPMLGSVLNRYTLGSLNFVNKDSTETKGIGQPQLLCHGQTGQKAGS